MKLLGLITLLFVVSTAVVYGQNDNTGSLLIRPTSSVDFYQEEITLTVDDSLARVEGVYHFRNNTGHDLVKPVIFPFYIDSVTQYPHEIEVFYIDSIGERQNIEFKERPERGCIAIRIPLAANPENIWYLNYGQKISSKRAVYIITSTATWKKPLEQGTYTFITPQYFNEVTVWPEADTIYTTDSLTYRQCAKQSFMPMREMEIIWK